MAGDFTLRGATADDAQAIADVYNPYIQDTTVTFDMELKSEADRVDWLTGRDARYPVLVAESGGLVVGWGALSRWSERPGWRHTVEVSTYVSPDATGNGIGSAVMAALLQTASDVGHHMVISQIVSGNAASEALVRRFDFRHVGTMREVGRKFDTWLDVELWEKRV